MENIDKNSALLEAILFLDANPQDEASLMRISGLGEDELKLALDNLKTRYSQENNGLELITGGNIIYLAPKKEYWAVLKDIYGKKIEGRLSRAAMETLSIIAYSQPVTKAEIKDIRGVDPDGMIRFLLEKNLIREAGKKDIPGKPVQYCTTKDFLQLFRLNSIAELPRLDKSEAERFELTPNN